MQFKGKLLSHTWENGEKPNFWSNFGPFNPNLGPQIFFMNFTFKSSQDITLCNLKEN